MPATIDYYMTCISPFTYLGHQMLRAVAEKHGAEIRVKPMNLFGVWEISGGIVPAKRPPIRQRLRLVELQRIADFRGMPINIRPKHFPTDPTLADLTVIALVEADHDPLGYMERIMAALWVNEEQIAEEDTLGKYLEAEGFDAGAILDKAKAPETAEIRASNTGDAIAADVVGAPGYVLNGEAFWGQDRVEYLDHALATGRKPFSAEG